MSQPFFARRSFQILLVAVFFMPLVLMASVRALRTNRNDVKDWLPEDFPETAVHRWFQEHFPFERFVLASWEGCTLEDPRLELLARKLETYDPELAELGITGQTADVLRAAGIDRRSRVLSLGDFRRFEELSSTSAREARQTAEAWESPFRSPVLTGRRLVRILRGRYPELTEEEVFERLEGSLVGPDHENTCLVVMLSESARGKNFRPTLEKIRRLARECTIEPPEPKPKGDLVVRVADGVSGLMRELVAGREPVHGGIHMGGPPVDNVAIDSEAERTLARLVGLSALVGLVTSWLMFRSVRLTFLVFLTANLCAGTGLTILLLSGGSCDAVLLSMPSLLYVLAISASIHLINYYHDTIRQRGLPGAPEGAVAMGWLPCALAAMTTAIGLGSLCASHVVPINKFGIYSAIGVMATLVWVFLFLPACLQFLPSRRYALEHGGRADRGRPDTLVARWWRAMGGFILRRNLWVTAGCTAVMVFFVVGAFKVRTSVKLMKLFSPDAPIVTHYAWLEEHLGPLVPMEVVLKIDSEKCRLSFLDRMRLAARVERAVEELDGVGGALSAATFAPDLTPEPARSGALRILGIDRRRTRDQLINRRLEAHRDEFRDYLAVDGNDELWRVSARVEALSDLDYGYFVDEIKEKVDPVVAAYREAGVEGIEPVYTGVIPLVYKTQHELMRGLFQSLAMAFVLIAVVMVLVLRSPAAGLMAMIPNLFPVVVIFGTMGWLGVLVDIGSMMTASVALGVAVDDTIHYLTWFRRGLDQGHDRKGAAMLAYERCATAMTQTTLIGGLGLAVFAFSTFVPTQRFGTLMFTLLLAALVGDLVFLPALLSGPIGRFFGPGRRRAKAARPALVPAPHLDRSPAQPCVSKPPAV